MSYECPLPKLNKELESYKKRDRKLQNDLNLRAASHPEVGDYWHERFAPILLVVLVRNGQVVCLHKTKDHDDNKWSWDYDSVLIFGSIESFRSYLMRDRFGSGSITKQTWADVIPGCCSMDIEIIKREGLYDLMVAHTDSPMEVPYMEVALGR